MLVLIVLRTFFNFFFPRSFGRFIGFQGTKFLSIWCLLNNIIIIFYSFWFLLNNSKIQLIFLGNWIFSNNFVVNWNFNIEPLTIIMLLVVNSISFLVHLFSTKYMENDAHLIRFMSYVSLFTFFMLILIFGDNLFILFFSWADVGLCSYLLISFWYTWIQANKSAVKAVIVNRISDFGLILGIIVIFYFALIIEFTNSIALLDFLTQYMIFLNNTTIKCNILTIISLFLFVSAFAKSTQKNFKIKNRIKKKYIIELYNFIIIFFLINYFYNLEIFHLFLENEIFTKQAILFFINNKTKLQIKKFVDLIFKISLFIFMYYIIIDIFICSLPFYAKDIIYFITIITQTKIIISVLLIFSFLILCQYLLTKKNINSLNWIEFLVFFFQYILINLVLTKAFLVLEWGVLNPHSKWFLILDLIEILMYFNFYYIILITLNKKIFEKFFKIWITFLFSTFWFFFYMHLFIENMFLFFFFNYCLWNAFYKYFYLFLY